MEDITIPPSQIAPSMKFSTLQLNGIDKRLYRPRTVTVTETIGTNSQDTFANSVTDGLNASQLNDLGVPTQKLQPGYMNVTQAALTLNIGNTVLSCDTTSNSIVLTLPDATTMLGRPILIVYEKKAGSNTVTYNTSSGDYFGGGSGQAAETNTTGTLTNRGDFVYLFATGSNTWWVIQSQNAFLGSVYKAVTTTYAVTLSDTTIEATSGTFTITLPTAVGIQSKVYNIKNSGAGTITLATTSAQTIDGSTTKTLTQYVNFTVMSNNANWIVL